LLWELFVTDGHVRASRLRFIAIPLVIIGAILVLLAQPPGGLAFPSTGTADFSGVGRNFQARATTPVIARLTVPPLRLEPDVIKQLAPTTEAPQVIKMIAESLKSTSTPPKDLPIKEISLDDFWSFNWPPTDIVHVKKDNIHLFGAIFLPQSDARYYRFQAIRWIGIFREDDGQWHNASLTYGDSFFMPLESLSVKANDIPVTLRKLMNIEDFHP
jgi:hypothetical protein